MNAPLCIIIISHQTCPLQKSDCFKYVVGLWCSPVPKGRTINHCGGGVSGRDFYLTFFYVPTRHLLFSQPAGISLFFLFLSTTCGTCGTCTTCGKLHTPLVSRQNLHAPLIDRQMLLNPHPIQSTPTLDNSLILGGAVPPPHK